MNSVYDVQQLLKRFGIYVYIGDRVSDLELMEMEVRELYSERLISQEEFQHSILILRRERNQIKKDKNKE